MAKDIKITRGRELETDEKQGENRSGIIEDCKRQEDLALVG